MLTDEERKERNRQYQRNWYAKNYARPRPQLTEEEKLEFRRWQSKESRTKRLADPEYRAKVALKKANWNKANPDKVKSYHQKTARTAQTKARQALDYKRLKAEDPQYGIMRRLRSRLGYVKSGRTKDKGTIALVGCSQAIFRQHVESLFTEGMSWDNSSEWHLTFRIPIRSFDLTDPLQQKLCFHYKNFEPKWANDGLARRFEKLVA